MSEEAWESETNTEKLLWLLRSGFSQRKLRHFVCACVQLDLPPPVNAEVTRILNFAEQIADDQQHIDVDEWAAIRQELKESWHIHIQSRTNSADNFAHSLLRTVGEDAFGEACWIVEDISDTDSELLTSFLRDIFGNPFRPIDFAPWRTDTALSLARQIYGSRDFGAMPVLADALEDAGCDNDEVLNHCRDAKQIHVRGCWVVDGVSGLV